MSCHVLRTDTFDELFGGRDNELRKKQFAIKKDFSCDHFFGMRDIHGDNHAAGKRLSGGELYC